MRRVIFPLLVLSLGFVFLLRVLPVMSSDLVAQLYFPVVFGHPPIPVEGEWEDFESPQSYAKFTIKRDKGVLVLSNLDLAALGFFPRSGDHCVVEGPIALGGSAVNPRYLSILSGDLPSGPTCDINRSGGSSFWILFETPVSATVAILNCIRPSICAREVFVAEPKKS